MQLAQSHTQSAQPFFEPTCAPTSKGVDDTGGARDVIAVVVRATAGAILLLAAFAESYFSEQQLDPTSLLFSKTGMSLRAGLNAALAIVLATGLWSRFMTRFAALVFLTYSLVSFARAASGFESCGCFGGFSISPALMGAVDVVVAGLLLLPSGTAHGVESPRYKTVAAVTLAAAVAAAVPVALIVKSNSPSPWVDGKPPAPGAVVRLKPEAWVGQRLPVLSQIHTTVPVHAGRWLIVLWDRGCGACNAKLPKYVSAAADPARPPVVLVDIRGASDQDPVPPADGAHQSGRLLVGRLDPAFRWLTDTPTEILLVDGVVVGVR